MGVQITTISISSMISTQVVDATPTRYILSPVSNPH